MARPIQAMQACSVQPPQGEEVAHDAPAEDDLAPLQRKTENASSCGDHGRNKAHVVPALKEDLLQTSRKQ